MGATGPSGPSGPTGPAAPYVEILRAYERSGNRVEASGLVDGESVNVLVDRATLEARGNRGAQRRYLAQLMRQAKPRDRNIQGLLGREDV